MPTFTTDVSTDVMSSWVAFCYGTATPTPGQPLTLIDPRTAPAFTPFISCEDAYNYWVMQTVLAQAQSAFPSSSLVTAQATAATATAAVSVLTFPSLVGGAQFQLTGSPNPITIARSSSGVETVTVVFVDPAYTGVITPTVSGLPSGVTCAFSPSTLSAAGSFAATLTVGSGAPVGLHAIFFVGTDANALNCHVKCGLNIT